MNGPNITAEVNTSPKHGSGPPPLWQVALVTWVAIYPIITGLLWLFGPWLSGLPLPLQTLAVTAILVPMMTYVAMPRLMALLQMIRQRAVA